MPFLKYFLPNLHLAGNPIKFRNSVKLNQSINDHTNIMRQVKFFYTAGNRLQSDFLKCSLFVKNRLFRIYCSYFYASQLWF